MRSHSKGCGGSMMECGGPRWLILVLILSVFVSGCCCFGCWEEERVALLDLKASMNYPNGQSLPSWVDPRRISNCCEWAGVGCDNITGRVIQLSLNSTRDWRLGDWVMNASIFLPFEKLRILYLPYNSIVGCVENEGFERLWRLSNLEVLDLTGNKINNTIFISLSGISSLKSLTLSSNVLRGYIYIQELIDLTSLEELDISYNQIKSFLPIKGAKRQSRQSSLEVLDLHGNLCNNMILSSLAELSSLKFINLAENQLNGSLHIEELDALYNLEELDMSSNNIDNFITPEGIESVSRLKVLHLNEVKFNASSLLRSLGSFPHLKTLSFQNGNFEGPITPQEMHYQSNLEELIMDHSSLNNDFLQSTWGMTSLKVLSLFSCGLNGTLPAQGWCELKNLQELDLSGNGFEGTLPSCMGNLTYLRVLDLSNNRLSGNIASSPLTTFTSLKYLSISNNHFEVPVSFTSFANYSSRLKVILSDNNSLVQDPTYQIWVPRFQLKLFSLSNSKSSDKLNVESLNFLHYQYDLRMVDLSHNNLQGKLPSWLLENNTRLKEFNVRENSLLGPFQLPSQPNPGILRIDISNNEIECQIPTNLSSVFPNLNILNLSRNAFYGKIPPSFGALKSLWALDLSNNHLSGVIPEQVTVGCLYLIFLKLSNNGLEGKPFPQMVNLPMLQCLYLDGNNFSGVIPDSLSNMSLSVLDISNNHISGKLPRWLGDMSTILEIALSNNHLRGPIPLEFCNLGNLLYLDLSENKLHGSIPSCFNPANIRHVHLYRNRLTGPMTCALYGSLSLATLDLRDNNLSGNIPKWVGTLSALSIFLLRGNQFEGRIPDQLCQLSRLRMLDLSRNNISGPIPGCLSNISFEMVFEKSLLSIDCIGTSSTQEGAFSYGERKKLADTEQYLNTEKYPLLDYRQQVEFTTKSRSYTYQGDILNYMSGIDFSCNNLTGFIPPELGNLSEVRALNFSHNNLRGTIPLTFSNLWKMESLDLSYNNLSGRIPPQLIQLNSLAVFSVAYNNLSGETPDQKAQFSTFEESSYEGNPLLCGAPLQNRCTNTVLPSPVPNSGDNEAEDDGLIDMGVLYVSFVVSYVTVLLGIFAILYINPYWRRAWFYIVEECATSSYYFVVDNFRKLFNFRNM